jgi:hypothetical protein
MAAHIMSQLGLSRVHALKRDFENFMIYDIDGSIFSSDMVQEAKAFADEVWQKTLQQYESLRSMSLFQLVDKIFQSHELFEQFHDSHLRIIQWFLALYEFEYFDQAPDVSTSSETVSVTGGLGQIPHGLAYGFDNSHVALEIACGRKVKNINIADNSITVMDDKDELKVKAVVMLSHVTL